MSSDPITLFVAMPYTDLGEFAKWKKPERVEKFYASCEQLDTLAGRVRLHRSGSGTLWRFAA